MDCDNPMRHMLCPIFCIYTKEVGGGVAKSNTFAFFLFELVSSGKFQIFLPNEPISPEFEISGTKLFMHSDYEPTQRPTHLCFIHNLIVSNFP